MIKVVEIQETVTDSNLIENIYSINLLGRKLIRSLEMIDGLNINDFDYMNVAVERCRIGLEKIYGLI